MPLNTTPFDPEDYNYTKARRKRPPVHRCGYRRRAVLHVFLSPMLLLADLLLRPLQSNTTQIIDARLSMVSRRLRRIGLSPYARATPASKIRDILYLRDEIVVFTKRIDEKAVLSSLFSFTGVSIYSFLRQVKFLELSFYILLQRCFVL